MAKLTKEEKKELRRQKREDRKKNGFWADFKKFITKGNVLDMAVGVVVGTAFNAIVNGLVKMIINPCVAYFTDGISLEELQHPISWVTDPETGEQVVEHAILYGAWIQTIIDFLIIALTVFVAVRVIRKMERKLNAKEIAEQEAIAAQKKAEDDAKAAEAKAAADAKAAAEKAVMDEYYENIREQSKLLREIAESVRK
ncbi:MAG: large conductance mechanosensitive channel protein MscL [Clostridia bacterium]|nr:large conductance mechanosensitive channel protein MscL [Clostridia bacterium]